MPNGVQTGAARPPGEPQPAPINTQAGNQESRKELHSWWRQFRHRGAARKDDDKGEPMPTGIFGVPLQESIRYANVAISLYDAEGNSYIYGYVPIVVAKCGVFLKEKATEVEGIFRLAGSEKRIKELRTAFNSPPRWGKGLNWEGYTVHDAANILRRYFNQLPEPIVPLEFYERFRQPLSGHQEQAVGPIDGQSDSAGDFNMEDAIRRYQSLITELPPLNRQLLLYILDLLAVFASKSDLNKMTTPNLAAIFQPGLISHPNHDMAPKQYRLSQDVLIFLIENQDHFLIGMQGTEVDEKTVQDVESGPPTPQAHTPTTPGRSKTLLGRSGSTSSAGADSVRKYGGVRRNVSVSSRHSRNSSAVSPVTPSFQGQAQSLPVSNNGSGSVHRSNTLPPKRSPSMPTARFGHQISGSSTPPTGGSTPPAIQEHPSVPAAPEVIPPSSSEGTTPLAAAPPPPDVAVQQPSPPAVEPNHIDTSVADSRPEGAQRDLPTTSTLMETPTSEAASFKTSKRGGLFAKSPSSEQKDPMRKPNKLQKKRMPGSSNPSAHSSTHSLTGTGSVQEGPPSPLAQGSMHTTPQKDQSLQSGAQADATGMGATLKPSASPPTSFRSRSTDRDHDPSASEAENDRGDDQLADKQQDELAPEEKKKRRWRLGNSKDGKRDKAESNKPEVGTPTAAGREQSMNTTGRENTMSTLGSNFMANRSHTSLTSLGDSQSAPRKSFQGSGDTDADRYAEGDDKSKEKGSGPLGWFRGKRAERKEKKEEKARAKSPPAGAVRGEGQPGSMLSLNSSPPRDFREGPGPPQGRGRSFDAQRELAQGQPRSMGQPMVGPQGQSMGQPVVQSQIQAQMQPQLQAQPPIVLQGPPQPHAQMQPQAQNLPPELGRPNELVLQALGPSSKAERGTAQ